MTDEGEIDDLEQFHFGSQRRLNRKMARLASQNDRSSDKQSDRDQKAQLETIEAKKQKQKLINSQIRGRVVEIWGQEILVVADSGENLICHLRGSFKEKKGRDKNIVAVGDLVGIDRVNTSGSDKMYGSIETIAPRYSQLSRGGNLNRNHIQLLATNIDIAMITVSVMAPMLRPAMIDRFLIAAVQGNLSPAICFTKTDLLQQKNDKGQQELLNQCLSLYQDQLRIPCFLLGMKEDQFHKEDLDKISRFIAGRTLVFSGPSGVGKSTIINALTGSRQRTGEVVHLTHKGAHTTSVARLIPLTESSGFVVDTPGIRSLALFEPTRDEIKIAFTEIAETARLCKYHNCQHKLEPGCAVKEAVETGKIRQMRYDSYQNIFNELEETYRRR